MSLNKAVFFLIISSLVWGATAPIMKLTLISIPLFSLAFLRMFFASLILWPFVTKSLKIKKEDFKFFLLCAIFGTNLNLAFFFLALKLTFAINASVIVASVPIFTIAAAHIYLREKYNLRLIVASLIAFLGIVIIFGKPIIGLDFKSTLGNLLLVFATLAWVGYEIISKKLLKIYSALTITFYTIFLGSLIFVPFAAFEYFTNPTWPTQVNLTGLLGLVYGIFFASILAYFCWTKGLSLMSASRASFFFYLDPISGIILSVILLGEKISPAFVAGAILIAFGVYTAESHRRSHILHTKLLGNNNSQE